MKNLKEFKALIQRYESITLKEIKTVKPNPDKIYPFSVVAKQLTGFGNFDTCTLCRVEGIKNDEFCNYLPDCYNCVYGHMHGCINLNSTLYHSIGRASSHANLFTAYRNRAKFMRELLIKKGINFRTLKYEKAS